MAREVAKLQGTESWQGDWFPQGLERAKTPNRVDGTGGFEARRRRPQLRRAVG
jgi:hypothetical protein